MTVLAISTAYASDQVEVSPRSTGAGKTPTPAKCAHRVALRVVPALLRMPCRRSRLPTADGTPEAAVPKSTTKPAPKSASKSTKKQRTEESADHDTAKARAAVLAAAESLPAQDGVRFTLMQEGAVYGGRDDTPEMLGQKVRWWLYGYSLM